MAHDFAKQRPSARSYKGRKTKGAARPGATPGTHWSWFFTGLLCGLFVAFVAYLGVLKPPPGGQAVADATQAEGAPETPERSVFDFYEYLPSAEVAVDVEPVPVAGEEPAPQDGLAPPPDFAAPESTAVAIAQSPSPGLDGDEVQYLLQAGSFQAREDAESRRASIILMNMQASVVPGTVSGKTWHRVQVGPFSGRAAAEKARDMLTSSNIDTIVLRMK